MINDFGICAPRQKGKINFRKKAKSYVNIPLQNFIRDGGEKLCRVSPLNRRGNFAFYANFHAIIREMVWWKGEKDEKEVMN